MSEYSMPSYFQAMPTIGTELAKANEDNIVEIQQVEQEIHELRDAALEAGRSTDSLNESGQWTAMQRIMELVDEDTWCPLNSLYNPEDNKDGSVGIVKGLGRNLHPSKRKSVWSLIIKVFIHGSALRAPFIPPNAGILT